jgi:hypothetical protein
LAQVGLQSPAVKAGGGLSGPEPVSGSTADDEKGAGDIVRRMARL